MEKKTGKKKTTNEKPILLYPLSAEEVLKKFLQTPLPPKGRKKRKPTRLGE